MNNGVNKGTVEYQDAILAITDIKLADGAFFVIAEGHGPIPEYHGPARVYGPDGLLVQDGGHIDCPDIPEDRRARLELTLTPSSVEALKP